MPNPSGIPPVFLQRAYRGENCKRDNDGEIHEFAQQLA